MNKSPQLYQFSPDLQLEYAVYGVGTGFLVCFHGFGQDLSIFKSLEKQLHDHQIISINLFFHGNSTRINAPKYLTHGEWKAVFGDFLNYMGIDRFSLVGYSLGGRYVASLLKSFSERIDHCILIAPDGVVKRFYYELVTFPFGFQHLFRFLMKNPRLIFLFLHFLERYKFVNPSAIKLSRSQLKEARQRDMVVRSWITLKKLRLPQRQLVAVVNNNQSFSITFIFGKHDSVIDPKKHFYFLSKLKKKKVFVLGTGHATLPHESVSTISKQLNGPDRSY